MKTVSLFWRRALVLSVFSAVLNGCAMFGGDDDDSEMGPAPLTEIQEEYRLKEVWSQNVGNGQGKLYNQLRPAIVGDRIYVAAANGDVEAFDRESGKSLWSTDLDVSLRGGVGAGEELVLVASGNGQVFALDAATGEKRWSAPVNSEVLAPPQTEGRVVVVQSFDGRVVGLDANDGRRLWSYAGGAPVLMLRGTSTPLLHEGAAIAGFANGKVVALDIASGKPFWETRVATPTGNSEIERLIDISGEMLVEDGVLYVGAYQGNLTALELRSGRRLWSRPASTHVGVSHGFGNVYVATAGGSVVALADNDQGPRWEQSALSRRELSGTAVVGNTVVVGDAEGYVHLLAQSDGRIVGRKRVDGDGVRVKPLVDGGLLYVYGNSGDIVAYRVESID